jgi:SRSO17 transposase
MPTELAGVHDPTQALQNFINESPWDEHKLWRRYRALLAGAFGGRRGVFVIHDLTFAKRGRNSVGVHRQYSSTAGKKSNCQTVVSLHYVTRRVLLPLAMRLYLPHNWLANEARLQAAKVPPVYRKSARTWQIALELLDAVRAEGWSGQAVVAEHRYGSSADFRAALKARGLPYLLEVTAGEPLRSETKVTGTGPASRLQTVGDLAQTAKMNLPSQASAAFGYRRHAWISDVATSGSVPSWLVLAERSDGTGQYALADLAEASKCRRLLHLLKCRQRIVETARRLHELGLDHFEGRSWRGFHHHACLVVLAYGFLALDSRTDRSRQYSVERLTPWTAMVVSGKKPPSPMAENRTLHGHLCRVQVCHHQRL